MKDTIKFENTNTSNVIIASFNLSNAIYVAFVHSILSLDNSEVSGTTTITYPFINF